MWTVLSFFKNIKWTPLRISIGINIILMIIIYFLFAGNNSSEEVVIREIKVEVPAQIGKMGPFLNPVPVSSEEKVDEDLLTRYNNLKSQYEKEKFCRDLMVIEESEYKETFRDSTQKIEVYTRIQKGKILEQAVEYEIDPYFLTIKDTIKSDIFKRNKILGGIELGLPLSHKVGQRPIVAKSTIYLQNKKDNIISLGIDTEKTVWAGYIIRF